MSQSFNNKADNPQKQQVPRHHRAAFVTEQRPYSKLQPIPQHVDEDHPEWYYGTAGLPAEASRPANPQAAEAAIEGTEELPSGYDLLASLLCTSQNPSRNSLPPLYRRFERLNHRILLQLQDEIAEMEEDLQHMDRVDACERAARQSRTAPASRRLDWQWRGNELHARRLELLGRIYLKVEQYSKLSDHPYPPEFCADADTRSSPLLLPTSGTHHQSCTGRRYQQVSQVDGRE